MGEDLIFPDEREGLTPYSLYCQKCGNYKTFYYETITKARVTVDEEGLRLQYQRIPENTIPSKREMAASILKRHLSGGSGITVEEQSVSIANISCANCGNDYIVLFGDVLYECYENQCIGCFKCGGAFNEDNIIEYCKQCLSMRRELSKDPSIFMLTLDMDLNCDACPIADIREGYGITGEDVKNRVFGRLKPA